MTLFDWSEILFELVYSRRVSNVVNFLQINVYSSCHSSNGVRKILIYPPPGHGPRGISINTEDYECLAVDQYLNDVIIDFYLRFLQEEVLTERQRARSHVFSQFFYKRLTTMQSRKTQADGRMTAAQRRHSRVEKWTKNENIFEKDFIIIPINEQQHWFLAIICFPGLTGPVTFDTMQPVKPDKCVKKKVADRKTVPLQIGNTTITPVSKRDDAICLGDESEKDEAEGDESDGPSDEEEDEVPQDTSSSPAIKQ